ncbi:DUF4209 domain-containing protein [Rhizobium sp. Root149]|uniref:DUF4209 domain-containing protein n=1 Tax=Rhizobium sp. Root149 TaxID=1736473 RepID=UPI000A61726E|nr:DUF4209 domain-containing protein [Rhizobium sp. Root149]
MNKSYDNGDDPTSTVFASADDLASIDVDAILHGLDRADEYALETAFIEAVKAAEAAGLDSQARGYRLLLLLCMLHLRTDDPAEPWGPRWQGPNGRSYTASDFRGEQTAILVAFIEKVTHPTLRARIADVVWYNDRRQGKAAQTAIEAYCEVVRGRLDGTYMARINDTNRMLDVVDWLHRALQINALARKRGTVTELITRTFWLLYERALSTHQYVAFTKAAYLGERHGLIEWQRIGPDAERLALERAGGDYPMAIKGVWDLASLAYGRIKDNEAQRRCQERSVDETLRMREQVGSASARAYWTRKAIGELRAARGFRDRIEALRGELRSLQDAALEEFGEFSIPLDLTKEQQGTIELFEGLTLPEILLQFAMIASSPKIEELRQYAEESQKTSILGSLFSSSYADHEGKNIAEIPAFSSEDAIEADILKAKSLPYLDLRRHQIVGGFIEPARENVMARFPLEERHFAPIVGMSLLVPPGHEHIFGLGFARFWQGDYASAAFLLIPQLENSLRHVLLNTNRDTAKIKPDLLQEDRSLSGLLENQRAELEAVFGVDLIFEIDLLFHYKPGPALRHQVAHGKMSAGACYNASGIYACWLIYRLACLPLVRYWKDQVAPAIEVAAF